MKKIRGQLGLYAKEREEFEQKKKALEEEMNKGKQNMEKLRKGIRINTSSPSSMTETDEDHSIKRTKSWKLSGGSRPETAMEQMKFPPTPTGPKISDWCYNSSLDSSPPILKSQEMYEDVRFLGRGSYGTVDLVKNREENKLFGTLASTTSSLTSLPDLLAGMQPRHWFSRIPKKRISFFMK